MHIANVLMVDNNFLILTVQNLLLFWL